MVIFGISYNLLFIITPAVPFIFLNRRLYFRWCSFAVGYYLLMLTCLLEDLLGIRVVLTGDNLMHDKARSIILLNHRTRLDWLYVWMLHSRFQILGQLKIVMKASLKRIPAMGWACQHAGYLFLQRDWERDQERIKNIIGYYQSCQSSLSLLIFPEGTNLTNETKTKSNNYVSKQPTYSRPYEYCLHPHVTGFAYLVNAMRTSEIIDAIDDVTIGYEGKFPITELDLLKGLFPKIVHFHVKRHKLSEIPQDEQQIGDWLRKCWDDKENRLKNFYENKYQFDSPSSRFNNEQMEFTTRFQRRLSLAFWILFILFWSYCIIAFVKIKLYVCLVCIFHLVMETYADGVIDFVCQLDANYRRARPAIKHD
ncbi:unnamed protein product [Adineta ricciae]|uniref:Phospholipid/glycerol acyltransferase domain-containing protein n=1 Tax=Adineta ricciae TaxID=249248 RepID=A0A816BCA2_ADIRI|nr:unnamed protein product [Adineta ricciae]